MDPEHQVRVGQRPERPVLVYDGDCGFCRQWVQRWRGITGPRVMYRPFQDVAEKYPEIGPEAFQAQVWLIEPHGRASSGAEAVLRLYALVGEKRWLGWLYDSLPGFTMAAEGVYGLVARHREAAAVATRWLWGDVAERPRYRRMRAILLRGLGLVYLAAFGSLAVQVDGLIGSRGILPAEEFLGTVRRVLGPEGYGQFPTLLWLDCSDAALHVLCWGGVAVSGLLVAGVLPGVCLALLWLSYLSLMVAGQDFLGFQWDALLLEAGLLGVLLAPWGAWLGTAQREPSRGVVWLIRWLVFRLMFLSGVVKLASGDPTWHAWEALRYHYETQPLPTWTSWYVHQLPAWFQKASVGLMFWAELIAPFLLFGPRRLRMVAFGSIVLLQVAIAATGNYGFFNLLTVVLCLALVEDRDWGRRDAGEGEVSCTRPTAEVSLEGEAPSEPSGRRGSDGASPSKDPQLLAAGRITPGGRLRRVLVGIVGAVVLLVTTMEAVETTWRTVLFPWPLEMVRQVVSPLRSTNTYGLFAVMTTRRPEIIVEGSADGVTWRPYRFRWKPGAVDRWPRFTTPHLPRLDWQMWFAALAPGGCGSSPWFLRFEQRLLEGSPPVLGLLRENPFPDKPPRFVRARLYRYRFTTWGEEAWWQREEVGSYCPPLEL